MIPEQQQEKRIFLIAEVANAHQGRADQAQSLVLAAAAAGVDAVKFQVFTADELCVKQHPKYEHFKKLALPGEQVEELCDLSRRNGIAFFCDAFGSDSARFLMSLPVDGIKIHSSDLSNLPMLRLLSSWDRKILLSCGGSSDFEIHQAVSILQASKAQLILLHGFQGFPTPISETHLNRVRYLMQTFGLPVGFMDHVDAEDEMAMTLPLLSLPAGAVLIEKHMTLNRSLKGIDYYSSLNPDEMKEFVQRVRVVESALGNRSNRFGAEEKQYRKNMKKHLVAHRAISEGTVIQETDICFKRTSDKAYSLTVDQVAGKQAIRNIQKEDTLCFSDLSLRVGILIIARMNSTRLPGKALVPIQGKPALAYLIERAKLCNQADAIVLCTTRNKEDDELVQLAKQEGIRFYRGDELNVLERMVGACDQERIDVAVRVTGDDILLSPEHLDKAVSLLMNENSDYCHNKGLPSGTECEVFTVRALKMIRRFAEAPENTEYLTYYVLNENFNKSELSIEPELHRAVDLTLDTAEDLKTVTFLLENIYDEKKPFTQKQLAAFIDQHPDRFERIRREAVDVVPAGAPNCRLNFNIVPESV